MLNETYMLGAFLALCFITVPVRTIIQNRRDSKYFQFIIGQMIYGIFWFATYTLGMMLIMNYGLLAMYAEIGYLILLYSFATMLGSVAMLYFNNVRLKHRQAEADKARNKHLKHKLKPYHGRKKGKTLR